MTDQTTDRLDRMGRLYGIAVMVFAVTMPIGLTVVLIEREIQVGFGIWIMIGGLYAVSALAGRMFLPDIWRKQ